MRKKSGYTVTNARNAHHTTVWGVTGKGCTGLHSVTPARKREPCGSPVLPVILSCASP